MREGGGHRQPHGGELRDDGRRGPVLEGGPGQQPGAAAWGGYSAGDFAAWCWLATFGNSGNVVAVAGAKPAITFASGDFAAMPPSPDGPAVP